MQIMIIVTSLIYTEYNLNISKLLILITHLHIYMKIHTHIVQNLKYKIFYPHEYIWILSVYVHVYFPFFIYSFISQIFIINF